MGRPPAAERADRFTKTPERQLGALAAWLAARGLRSPARLVTRLSEAVMLARGLLTGSYIVALGGRLVALGPAFRPTDLGPAPAGLYMLRDRL
ncbi:MAG TPA: hypothetical protein PKD53_12450, partial [Chloroflexaceae bacterium]|nr:hypothetical protein [Chloroflexaceae bacterium]